MADYDVEDVSEKSEELLENEETVQTTEDETNVTDETAATDETDVTEDAETTFSEDETEQNTDDFPQDAKKSKRKKKIIIFGAIAAAIIILIAVLFIVNVVKKNNAAKNTYTDVAVERRTITNTITGSSSIEPNDSYDVMTIKSGDITADYFKEGDTVKKGDKLYQFDDKDARNSLSSAQNSLTKAQQSYVDAVKQKAQTVSSNNIGTQSAQNSVTKALTTLDDAQKSYNDQYVTSDISGKVMTLYVSKGDTVNNGAEIADVYDDSYMKIRLPFNDYDAENVYTGAVAEVSIVGSGDVIYGTVTEKASQSTATDAHTMVVYATIEIANPGALTVSDSGSAVVNGVACTDTAKFEYTNSKKITAKASGTIENLSVSQGDGVYAGEQIAYIKSDSVSSTLSNAQLTYNDALLSLQKQVLSNDTYSQDSSIKNAQLALDDAKLSLEKAEDAVDDYLVEAPIEGTVVTKNAKSGDTIDSTNGSEALCVIYDLSCVKLSIDVDETEIALVQTGQKATITADAVEGEFEGEVIKVPVDGVNENGVTTYTIEIQIDDYGDLLPGMNVNAEIIVEEADNVLAIPVNSVNRGNIVFIKDDGSKHDNDVTDIIKGNAEKDSKDNSKDSGGDSALSGEKTGENNEKSPMGTGAPEKEDSGAEKSGERRQPDTNDIPVVSSPQDAGKTDAGSQENGKSGSAEKSGLSGGLDTSGIPMNIEVPDGYRAILVETGINDTEYIEIKSGLSETDMVRTLNTESSSANASFGSGEEAQQGMNAMGGMGGMSGGGMPGSGMGGAPGGGGAGGGMGGNRGGR